MQIYSENCRYIQVKKTKEQNEKVNFKILARTCGTGISVHVYCLFKR